MAWIKPSKKDMAVTFSYSSRFSALRALSPFLCLPLGPWLLLVCCCPPPPLPFCVWRFSFLPLGALFFFSSSCVCPRCLWLSLVSGPGCPGPWRCVLFVLWASRCSALRALFLVCVSRLAVGCSLVVAAPPPPFLCLAVFVAAAVLRSFCFSLRCAPPLSLAFSGFRPQVLWASALCVVCFVGLPLLGSPCALTSFVLPARRLAAPWWLLPPPPPLSVSRFSLLPLVAVCRVLCCAVSPWVRCCAALLRVVPPGVVLLCAVFFGCACLVPLLVVPCPLALPVALGPCALRRCFLRCSPALCVFCRGVVVRAVVRCSALCCVCPGVLCCAFPVLSASCGAVLRCAGALALCCSCGLCCCWRLVLWCAAVCCAVSFGMLWCGAGSGGPWLSAGCVVRCRCPCLAAWSASLWLVWFAVVPCFPVSCSVVLCCRVVLCCCFAVLLVLALPSCGLSCCAVLCCWLAVLFFARWCCLRA